MAMVTDGSAVVTGTAVVTGAGRGLGRAIALELARRGLHVVATMRDVSAGASLRRHAAGEHLSLDVQRLDVTAPGDWSPPDDLRVLVNSAGVRLQYLPVEHTDLDEWHDTFRTNVFGLAELTKRAIPALRANRGGVICNVSSAAILLPHPFMATYRASKAAVSALCDSLRAELAPFGIRVVEVLPGPIGTDLLRDSIMVRPPEAVRHEPYRELADRQHEISAASRPYVTSPEDAARAIADAVLLPSGPMRVGCDPVSVDQIAHWRASSDEQLAGETFARLGLLGGEA
jgi:NAD(P)-dependent dehydrogenase (short-subunit alcohol dehydrogenase family)